MTEALRVWADARRQCDAWELCLRLRIHQPLITNQNHRTTKGWGVGRGGAGGRCVAKGTPSICNFTDKQLPFNQNKQDDEESGEEEPAGESTMGGGSPGGSPAGTPAPERQPGGGGGDGGGTDKERKPAKRKVKGAGGPVMGDIHTDEVRLMLHTNPEPHAS